MHSMFVLPHANFLQNIIIDYMITIVHATMMLGLIVLPLLRKTKKANAPVVLKNDCDTTHAHYAVNCNGYLEKVAGDKVSTGGVID